MIRPKPNPIPNEEDVDASSNSWCSVPSRRSPTDSAGSGPSTCRTASGPADAYAALTDAGSFAAARTVPGTGEDLVHHLKASHIGGLLRRTAPELLDLV
jgi:hypothetical protein